MNVFLPASAFPFVQASDLAALPLIEKWISFSSVTRDSNLPIIEWTQHCLEALGIECSSTYDDSGLKANLWAALPADNGETKIGRLVLRTTRMWYRSTASPGTPIPLWRR